MLFATFRVVTAELMVTPTLEWLADHCVDSGVYQVTAVEKNASVTESYLVKFELQESLRGEPKKTTEGPYYRFRSTSERERPLVKVGDEFLICFQHLRDGHRIAEHHINSSRPATVGPPFDAIYSGSRCYQKIPEDLHPK